MLSNLPKKNWKFIVVLLMANVLLLASSCKKQNSVSEKLSTGNDFGKSLAGGAPRTITRNGITLNITDNSTNFSQTILNRMIENFFNVYPKLIARFNANAPKTVNWIIDPNTTFAGTDAAGATTSYGPAHLTDSPYDMDEITHECTHIVQAYTSSNVPGWLTEGIADYGRNTYGQYNTVSGWNLGDYQSGQTYTQGYGVCARFLIWCEQNYASNIVDQLNTASRQGTYTPNLWNTITGKSVDQLFAQYQQNSVISKIIWGATYRIVSALNNSSVLDVTSAGTADYTKVQLYQSNRGTAQRWTVTNVGFPYMKLQPLCAPTKCLDVYGSGTADGTQIDIYSDNSSNAQKWNLVQLANGNYNMQSAVATNSRLDINGSSTTNGTKVQLYTSNNSNAQQFKFVQQTLGTDELQQ